MYMQLKRYFDDKEIETIRKYWRIRQRLQRNKKKREEKLKAKASKIAWNKKIQDKKERGG